MPVPVRSPCLEDWPKFWKHGQWNELRARIEGNPPHITTWIKGVKFMDWTETRSDIPTRAASRCKSTVAATSPSSSSVTETSGSSGLNSHSDGGGQTSYIETTGDEMGGTEGYMHRRLRDSVRMASVWPQWRLGQSSNCLSGATSGVAPWRVGPTPSGTSRQSATAKPTTLWRCRRPSTRWDEKGQTQAVYLPAGMYRITSRLRCPARASARPSG